VTRFRGVCGRSIGFCNPIRSLPLKSTSELPVIRVDERADAVRAIKVVCSASDSSSSRSTPIDENSRR